MYKFTEQDSNTLKEMLEFINKYSDHNDRDTFTFLRLLNRKGETILDHIVIASIDYSYKVGTTIPLTVLNVMPSSFNTEILQAIQSQKGHEEVESVEFLQTFEIGNATKFKELFLPRLLK